jgi:transposase-like protein
MTFYEALPHFLLSLPRQRQSGAQAAPQKTAQNLKHDGAYKQEIKRGTRVAVIFPNEASLLSLVASLLMEISDDWESQKIYLRMDHLFPIL